MSKTSFRLWLIGSVFIIVFATILASASAAPRIPELALPSTPAVPEGGGVLIERWAPERSDASPGADVILSIDDALSEQQIQLMLDAAQQTGRVDSGVQSEEVVSSQISDELWQVVDLRSGPDVEFASNLLTHLKQKRLLEGAHTGSSRLATPQSLLGPTQLLGNPGFETGSWPPWIAGSNGDVDPTLTNEVKHTGNWSAHLGNELSSGPGSYDIDLIFQTIMVPSVTPDEVQIEFWLRTSTSETFEGCDYLYVVIWDSDEGSPIWGARLDMAVVGTIPWTRVALTLDEDEWQGIVGNAVDFSLHLENDYSNVSRAWVDDTAFIVTTATTPVPTPTSTPMPTPTPQPDTPECVELLRNPEMNVVELGDGTGTIEYWAILRQNVYYDNRPGYYQSPYHALVMMDETAESGRDTDVISATLDVDMFAQGFVTPLGLTELRVQYSRLYTNTNDADNAYSILWTLTDDGYLDELIEMVPIGETPESWSNRYWELTQSDDAALLAALSSRPLAIAFALFSDRAPPSAAIWLDDIQVRACYQRAPSTVYLPTALRSFGAVSEPTCFDLEPDSVTSRGHVDLGAICDGRFSAVDQRDYYSLRMPAGVVDIRLNLFDLPSDTNWDALIYEDAAGFPLACHIGTYGSADKYTDCTLNDAKTYFVMVNAGTAPLEGQNTYRMSVAGR